MTVNKQEKFAPMILESIGKVIPIGKDVTLSYNNFMDLLDYIYEQGKEEAGDDAFEAGLNYGNPGV